jgi:ABC-type multidrug transport system ATPase subunit
MMTISLSDVSKRFNRDWIFRNFNYTFSSEHSYAITGPNGSGKSTLLQVIGGAIAMSEGEIEYRVGSRKGVGSRESGVGSPEVEVGEAGGKNPGGSVIVPADLAYQYISLAAPYLEVIEEMTAIEFLDFHRKFKPLLSGCTVLQILSTIGLEKAARKQIRFYSSGMKQRIKLAQAIFSDTPCILLDEPCTNLDSEGIELYRRMIDGYCKGRLVIVSSNDIAEYSFCKEKISILDYK